MRHQSKRTARHALLAIALGWLFAASAPTPSLAETLTARHWDSEYSGRCSIFLLSPRPNQRTWYRYYLYNWRYGDERDFSCFIQEY